MDLINQINLILGEAPAGYEGITYLTASALLVIFVFNFWRLLMCIFRLGK